MIKRPIVYINLIFVIIILFTTKMPSEPIESRLIQNLEDYPKLFRLKSIMMQNSLIAFGDKYSPIVNSLVLGEKLPYFSKKTFSTAGLSHLFAISGMHIGILYLMLKNMLESRLPAVVYFFSCSFLIICYGIMTGLSYATLRAVIMCIITLYGSIICRESDSLNSLSIASIIILVYKPMAVYSASFVLSFVVLSGIVIYGEVFELKIYKNKSVQFKNNSFIRYITSVVCSFLASFPITFYFFSVITPKSIIANFFVLFIVPFIFGFSLFTLLTGITFFRGFVVMLIDYINLVVDKTKGVYIFENEIAFVYVVVAYLIIYFFLMVLGEYFGKNKE